MSACFDVGMTASVGIGVLTKAGKQVRVIMVSATRVDAAYCMYVTGYRHWKYGV